MTGRGPRWLGFGLVAIAGAGMLALTSTMNSAVAYGDPVPNVTEVIGGSGIPIPPQDYVDAVNDLYIQQNLPGTTPVALFTPEGLYPLTGINSLPLDTSVSQGLTILNNTIATNGIVTDPIGVFAYSQSSVISSLEMENLEVTDPTAPITFVLTGDPMNPDGGIAERFADLDLASLGQTFSGATPADDFPTTIYTLEYDGFADFPQYPINLLADLNAAFGIAYVHTTYADPATDVGSAILLPGSEDSVTDPCVDCLTNYYMIPVENLPLLDPLREIPIVGNPLADLVQPDLSVIVNLGYGSIADGWSQGPADVPTPFELFPTNIDPMDVLAALWNGAGQGVTNFIDDLTGSGPNPLSLALTPLSDPFDAYDPEDTEAPQGLVNILSSLVSTDFGVLLPTTDILNSVVTTLAAYDATLFEDGLQSGDLLSAIGDPIAADFALASVGLLYEVGVLAEAGSTTIADLSSLFS